MLDILHKSITPMNFQEFNEFLEHRKKITRNLKKGECPSGAICNDPKCLHCQEYLRRMKVKDGYF